MRRRVADRVTQAHEANTLYNGPIILTGVEERYTSRLARATMFSSQSNLSSKHDLRSIETAFAADIRVSCSTLLRIEGL